MSIHKISQQHLDATESLAETSQVAPELAIDPLWIVTFAAALLFTLLAVFVVSS